MEVLRAKPDYEQVVEFIKQAWHGPSKKARQKDLERNEHIWIGWGSCSTIGWKHRSLRQETASRCFSCNLTYLPQIPWNLIHMYYIVLQYIDVYCIMLWYDSLCWDVGFSDVVHSVPLFHPLLSNCARQMRILRDSHWCRLDAGETSTSNRVPRLSRFVMSRHVFSFVSSRSLENCHRSVAISGCRNRGHLVKVLEPGSSSQRFFNNATGCNGNAYTRCRTRTTLKNMLTRHQNNTLDIPNVPLVNVLRLLNAYDVFFLQSIRCIVCKNANLLRSSCFLV